MLGQDSRSLPPSKPQGTNCRNVLTAESDANVAHRPTHQGSCAVATRACKKRHPNDEREYARDPKRVKLLNGGYKVGRCLLDGVISSVPVPHTFKAAHVTEENEQLLPDAEPLEQMNGCGGEIMRPLSKSKEATVQGNQGRNSWSLQYQQPFYQYWHVATSRSICCWTYCVV